MTKLYFRATTNATSGLPTNEQSTLTSSAIGSDAATVNRTLSETKGTTMSSIALTSAANTSLQTGYWSRFVSDTLSMTSIPSQTWDYNCAVRQTSNFANFPASSSGPIYVHCYIWRPSNSSKIATILDGNSASNATEPEANNTRVLHVTFSGASVSFATGDVIVFEIWFRWTQVLGSAQTLTWYYDGLTENTTNNADVTNHASFINSPQTLTFGVAPVDTTVTGKAIETKQIVHG